MTRSLFLKNLLLWVLRRNVDSHDIITTRKNDELDVQRTEKLRFFSSWFFIPSSLSYLLPSVRQLHNAYCAWCWFHFLALTKNTVYCTCSNKFKSFYPAWNNICHETVRLVLWDKRVLTWKLHFTFVTLYRSFITHIQLI